MPLERMQLHQQDVAGLAPRVQRDQPLGQVQRFGEVSASGAGVDDPLQQSRQQALVRDRRRLEPVGERRRAERQALQQRAPCALQPVVRLRQDVACQRLGGHRAAREAGEGQGIGLDRPWHERQAVPVGRQQPHARRFFQRVDQATQAGARLRRLGVRPQQRGQVFARRGAGLEGKIGQQREAAPQRQRDRPSASMQRRHPQHAQRQHGFVGAGGSQAGGHAAFIAAPAPPGARRTLKGRSRDAGPLP